MKRKFYDFMIMAVIIAAFVVLVVLFFTVATFLDSL